MEKRIMYPPNFVSASKPFIIPASMIPKSMWGVDAAFFVLEKGCFLSLYQAYANGGRYRIKKLMGIISGIPKISVKRYWLKNTGLSWLKQMERSSPSLRLTDLFIVRSPLILLPMGKPKRIPPNRAKHPFWLV